MYIVKNGAVDLLVRDKLVETVAEGGFFGEIAMVDHSPKHNNYMSYTETRKVFDITKGAIQFDAQGLKEIVAKTIGKSIWMLVGILFLGLVVVAYATRNSGTAVAGLSLGELISVELILFLSGLMSGLSGFGFSAVGAGCLLFIQPITEAPLLQNLSTCNQFLSLKQLRKDMPKSWKAFWEGPGFCILGGVPGALVGTWMLSHLPAEQLMKIFGTLLVLYSIYSIFKPAGAKLRGFASPVTGAIVGFIGGAIGGFTAFPGAAVVVWTSLRDAVSHTLTLARSAAARYRPPLGLNATRRSPLAARRGPLPPGKVKRSR